MYFDFKKAHDKQAFDLAPNKYKLLRNLPQKNSAKAVIIWALLKGSHYNIIRVSVIYSKVNILNSIVFRSNNRCHCRS